MQTRCGGLGVFAKERILKNTWLTEYGGEIIDVQEAKRRRSRGEDTHIRSAGYQVDSATFPCA